MINDSRNFKLIIASRFYYNPYILLADMLLTNPDFYKLICLKRLILLDG